LEAVRHLPYTKVFFIDGDNNKKHNNNNNNSKQNSNKDDAQGGDRDKLSHFDLVDGEHTDKC
jgi:hypothetical protein